jgi:hypothetical protein
VSIDPLCAVSVDHLGIASVYVWAQVCEKLVTARQKHFWHCHYANADSLVAQNTSENSWPNTQILGFVVQLVEKMPILFCAALNIDFRQQRQSVSIRLIGALHKHVFIIDNYHAAAPPGQLSSSFLNGANKLPMKIVSDR